MKKKISYKDAGVDIESGNLLINDIKSEISKTYRKGVISNIGGFAGLFDLKKCHYKDPILVSGTDGVGTKLKIAIDSNNFDYIGQDLVAMCVNDLLVQGAEPLFFLDYFACSKLDNNIAKNVITSIASGCKKANIALIGGETAEMPDIYHNKDFDLAGFAVGIVERDKILPRNIEEGNILIAIPSSGIHSNGFSLVRKVMSEYNLNYDHLAEFSNEKDNMTYKDIFLTPTEIYVDICLELYNKNLVKGFCHITGGGFIENIPRILPNNLSFHIDYHNFELSPLFLWLEEKTNLAKKELFRVFNCGFGMIVIAEEKNSNKIITLLKNSGYHNSKIIGTINNRNYQKIGTIKNS